MHSTENCTETSYLKPGYSSGAKAVNGESFAVRKTGSHVLQNGVSNALLLLNENFQNNETGGKPAPYRKPFSVPNLPARDGSVAANAVLASVSIQALLIVMRAMDGGSLLESLRQQQDELKSLQNESVKQNNEQQTELKRIEGQKKEMEPGQIAGLVISGICLLLSIIVPFAAPALMAATGIIGGISAGVSVATSALFFSIGVADYAIKHSPTPVMALNEKGEEYPLEGMSIDIIVGMAYDQAARDGSIIIDGEPGKGNPAALRLSADDFKKAKSDASKAVNLILIILPILCGFAAFLKAAGGLEAIKKIPELLKKLPETIKEVPAKIASVASKAASEIQNVASKVGEFARLGGGEMLERIVGALKAVAGAFREFVVSGNAESMLRVTENVASIGQASVRISQSAQALQLSKLQAKASETRMEMQGTQGKIDIINGHMPIMMSIFKEIQDAKISTAKAVALIVQQSVSPALFAARNMAAASA